MVVERCRKILNAIFGDSVTEAEIEHSEKSKSIVFSLNRYRLITIKFINIENYIFQYEVDFNFVKSLLSKSKIKIENSIIIDSKYKYKLGAMITNKYLKGEYAQNTFNEDLFDIHIPISLVLDKLDSVMVTKESINIYNEADDEYVCKELAILSFVKNGVAYSFPVNKNILRDNTLISSMTSAVLKHVNNLSQLEILL